MQLVPQQHDRAVNGTHHHIARNEAGVPPRAHPRHAEKPPCLEDLLPRLRAVGVTSAVADIAGAGEGTRVKSVTVYPCSSIRIRAGKRPRAVARTPAGEIRRWGGEQVPAADAIREVVDGMIQRIRWANGHHGRLWIEVNDGSTRLELHADHDRCGRHAGKPNS